MDGVGGGGGSGYVMLLYKPLGGGGGGREHVFSPTPHFNTCTARENTE
jgi:hypothetical protein